ncbi:hypothetical protein [Lysinibacillus sp. NPDC093692]|uniref:hypothetical protein n=1 Tax=Lysinibacillus sp. NPDC093692 TaxID=3390578 RepID=UPI003D08E537
MNYNRLNTKKEYLKVISYLNKLEVVCNFENHSEFLRFLQIYMRSLTRLGICHAREYLDDYSNFEQASTQIAKLELIKKQLVNTKIHHQSLGIVAMQDDLTIIIAFLDKLLEIIQFNINLANLQSNNDRRAGLQVNRSHLESFDNLENC